MGKTEFLSVRVTPERFQAVIDAASAESITKAQWLDMAIARSLGKRPRLPLETRIMTLEREIKTIKKAIAL